MKVSMCHLPCVAKGAPQDFTAPRANIVNAFDASERRFGEHFDISTHAAVIKMMMMTFGRTPARMFDHIRAGAEGYAITMKDEFQVQVSNAELQQAALASRFEGPDSTAVQDANFVFAAFVKRKQLVGGYPSFAAALAKTLQGETTLRCLQGMGVYGFSQLVPPSQMVGPAIVAVVETNSMGSALVVDGTGHHYGVKHPIGQRYGYRLFDDRKQAHTPVLKSDAGVSAVPVGMKPDDIWGGFYQGSEQNNCVTVSAIKAAMMRFGQNPAGIYKQVMATLNGYAVTMRDGFSLSLTHAELTRAKAASSFRGADPALVEDANFLFAVSARRAQMENNDFRASRSFDAAIETLNDGDYPGHALRRLGLFAYIRESDASALAKGAIGTLADHGHSVAVINGVVDYYGRKHHLASSRWMNSGFRAFKLA